MYVFPCRNYCKHYGSLVRAHLESVVIIVNIVVNWSKKCFIFSLLMDRGSRVEASLWIMENYLLIAKQINTPCCLENQFSSESKERSPVASSAWKQRLRVEEEEFAKRKLRYVLIFFLLILIFFYCRVQ